MTLAAGLGYFANIAHSSNITAISPLYSAYIMGIANTFSSIDIFF